MGTILIKMSGASFRHRNQSFYENFNWTVKKGENWVITGACGAGKSVLVQALSGIYYLGTGTMSYPFLEKMHTGISKNETSNRLLEKSANKNRFDFSTPAFDYVNFQEEKKTLVRVVSFRDDSRVFSPNLYFYQQRYTAFAADGTLTVWEYLMNAGFDERIKEHIDLIKKTGVFPMLDLERIKLSSGQSRRLLITKAILQKPKILIIDNPYLGLDAPSRKEFNALLDDLVQEEGLQLILAGHYKELPTCMTHQLHLDRFKIAYEGPIPSKAFIDPKIGSNTKDLAQQIQAIYTPPKIDSTTIFDLQKVKVAYGEKVILSDFNWQVQQGEKWALLGNNGSGKSTILSLLFGDHPQAYANDIYLFGQKRGMGQSIWDIKKNTGFTSPELHYFFSYKMTCLETVQSGLFDHVYLKRAPNEKEQLLINLLFDYFHLQDLKDRSFQSISTGEQRQLLLMRALIKNPPLLLLDEPFQGLDPAVIEKAKYLLSTILTAQHTLVFISHYVEEIPEIVQQVKRIS